MKKMETMKITLINLTEGIELQHREEMLRDFTKPRINVKLNPWQVTGFTDSEGGFNCNITKTGKGKTGFKVRLELKITQKTHS